ncbi:DUF6428 family protein [Hoeflea sp. 108]|jgi:hypothetical protein|uniref:DUF6428 family protein n=1 Tax=Hoeflea sp. 108 TaxID=1116369 RepID=UPI0003800064|nr:DUF6428 family protein [Hoeflea sp. 108]
MNALGKDDVVATVLPDPGEATIGSLLGFFACHPKHRVTFRYDGRTARPGYHVTEVKAGAFAALDCGANPESWDEIFVQLWDVDDSPEQMTAGKFSAIVRKVTEHVALDMDARLTFEVSDGILPMQLHRAAAPEAVEDEIVVELSPRPASCKPRDRWLAEQSKSASGCCGSVSAKCCQ